MIESIDHAAATMPTGIRGNPSIARAVHRRPHHETMGLDGRSVNISGCGAHRSAVTGCAGAERAKQRCLSGVVSVFIVLAHQADFHLDAPRQQRVARPYPQRHALAGRSLDVSGLALRLRRPAPRHPQNHQHTYNSFHIHSPLGCGLMPTHTLLDFIAIGLSVVSLVLSLLACALAWLAKP